MTDIAESTCTIEILPEYLDEMLEMHILNALRKKFDGTCSKTHGYILRVIRIVSLRENILSRTTANILFPVVFEMERFLPVEGKRVSSIIQMIRPYGILSVYANVKIFVASKDLGDFNAEKGMVGTRVFKLGDSIPLALKSVQYKNREFHAIATPVFE